jgi:hypothetical protein
LKIGIGSKNAVGAKRDVSLAQDLKGLFSEKEKNINKAREILSNL